MAKKYIGLWMFLIALFSLPIVLVMAFFVRIQIFSVLLSTDSLIMAVGSWLVQSAPNNKIEDK